MKLLHISDLHIGKKVKGFSLLEDQKYILEQIAETLKEKEVDGLIIAGDIYDVSSPSNDAICLFDKFITTVHSMGVSCYVVSGNHDSVYRVAFCSDIMAKENVHFAKRYEGEILPIEADKNINIWLLPFIRPTDVREYHSDFATGSYDEMMRTVIKHLDIDTKKTNILVAHQFITNAGKPPEKSESEIVSLGTLDNIDVSVFDDFDYVALGHIHKPQIMGRDTVRYSGSPLKYSFSEKDDKKAMVLIEITSNKKIKQELIPFKPLRDMQEYVGTFDKLSKYPSTIEDFVRIVIKDELQIIDVKHKLENRFKNIMEIIYDNASTKENKTIESAIRIKTQTPFDLFNQFYEQQNNQPLNDEQVQIVKKILTEMEETV